MSIDLDPVPPAVLSAPLQRWLHGLVSFRRFVRHAYDVPLDSKELRRHVDSVLCRRAELRAALEKLGKLLSRARDATGGS